MKFGINSWAWKLPVHESNIGDFLRWAEQLGIPGEHRVIEIFASPDPEDLPGARAIRDAAAGAGFGVVSCGFNPHMAGPGEPNPHLISPDPCERSSAIRRACGFVSYAAAAAVGNDPGVLSGPWHTRHMHFTGSGLTPQERSWLVEGLGAIAKHAGDLGVLAGFEILNRFESYVLNTVDEALDVIREVGNPNLGFNWDSSHAHIDESEDVVANLTKASLSGHLFHVHLCENHRRAYGSGRLGPLTREILQSLDQTGYAHGIVPELFCPVLDGAIHKWNRSEGGVDDAARSSFAFLRTCL